MPTPPTSRPSVTPLAYADTVVVGGGVVGLLTAIELRRAGQSVVVLEATSAGRAQSGRNMGFVRQQGRGGGEAALVKRASELWGRLHHRLGDRLGLIRGGHLSIARDPRSAIDVQAWASVALEHGIPFELLERQQIAERFPWLDGAVVMAGYTANDFHLDPAVAMAAIHGLARSEGVEVLEGTPVTSLDVEAGDVVGVLTPCGDVRASATVLAAGMWTSRLLRPHGVRLPQYTGVGTVARTAPTEPLTTSSVWDVSGIGMRQDSAGRINFGLGQYVDIDLGWEELSSAVRLLPTYLRSWRTMRISAGRRLSADVRARLRGRQLPPFPFEHPEPSTRLVAKARAELLRLVPTLDPQTPVELAWAGTIDSSADFLPAIGQVGLGNLVVATSMSGHGMGIAPAVAEAVAEMVRTGTTTTVDVSGLRPGRLAGFRPYRAGGRR